MEAELFEPQKRQDDLDRADSKGNPDIRECLRSWPN